MFRQFRNPKAKDARQIGETKPFDIFFVCAEFLRDDEGCATNLRLAVTDTNSAWIVDVAGDDLVKLAENCRIGQGTLEDFVEHTTKAMTADDENSEYVVEAKQTGELSILELKWKIREAGFSQIIGQAKLTRPSDQTAVIMRMLTSLLSFSRSCQYECEELELQIKETSRALEKLNELAKMPDISSEILERSVEVINEAKRRNRELGGTTEGFDEAWELATLPVEDEMVMDGQE